MNGMSISNRNPERNGAGPIHTIELASLQVIAAAQKTGEDIEKSQLQIVTGIRDIFEADGAMVILFDEENHELVIKKALGRNNTWTQQSSQKLDSGIIADCIRQGMCMALPDVSQNPNFNPYFDSIPKIKVHSYLCSPLASNLSNFGALALINPLEQMLTEDRVVLFQMLSTTLANAFYNARLFQQLKISNADLEASRWELLNSRNTLRALFDNLPTSIYIVDEHYSVIAVNMSRVNRLGDKPNQFVGRLCYEKFYQRNSPCPDCRVAETFISGQDTSRVKREELETGQYQEWEINTFPIYNDHQKPVQTIITEYDVTEKHLLEADLIQSEKLAAIGQLAAGVAHEIYNPLTAIIVNSQLIRRMLPTVNEDLFESLDLIENAGVRASQVIRGLLGAARKEEMESSPVDLNHSIESALALLNHEINKRPVVIEKNFQANMPLLTGNQDHLQGVWINLIMNALDAIESNEGTIQITTRLLDAAFEVTIYDNGKGIPKNKLSRIFEPYFTTKGPGQGTGLGLSVCFRVVKQHGGTIQVESKPDKGTKFIVLLPLTSLEVEEEA